MSDPVTVSTAGGTIALGPDLQPLPDDAPPFALTAGEPIALGWFDGAGKPIAYPGTRHNADGTVEPVEARMGTDGQIVITPPVC